MKARLVFLTLSILGLLVGVVACGRVSGPQVEVQNAWARPTFVGMGGKVTSAVYMTLVNRGSEADRLVDVTADIAEAAEIHESYKEGDIMKMRPVEGGLEIPGGGQVQLRPGGYHIMLIGVRRPLKPGDKFTITLRFEKSGERQVTVEVREQ